MGADIYSRRVRKLELERKRLIHCGFCRINRGENSKRYPNKSWKGYRKNQWRV